MAHEIEINENGEARAFYAGKAPWHGLGTMVEKEVTAAAAIKLAGLDWVVEKRPLFAQSIENDSIGYCEIDTHKAVVRAEDNKILGIVTDAYEPIQNEDLFEFMEALVGDNVTMFHCAGSLFGGKRVFITCKMPKSIEVGPDKVDMYLVACSSHDGSMQFHIKWTPIRVVCWNTVSAAFQIYGGRVRATDTMSILHRGGWKNKLQEARKVLELSEIYQAQAQKRFEWLRKQKMKTPEFKAFAEQMWPDEEKDDGKIIDRSKLRDAVRQLYHHGVGNEVNGVKGTRWAALNAVTEYIDHHRTYSKGKYGDVSDNRMNSVVWGSGANIKKKALELLSVS